MVKSKPSRICRERSSTEIGPRQIERLQCKAFENRLTHAEFRKGTGPMLRSREWLGVLRVLQSKVRRIHRLPWRLHPMFQDGDEDDLALKAGLRNVLVQGTPAVHLLFQRDRPCSRWGGGLDWKRHK